MVIKKNFQVSRFLGKNNALGKKMKPKKEKNSVSRISYKPFKSYCYRYLVLWWFFFSLLALPIPPTQSNAAVSFGNAVWMHADTFASSSILSLENLADNLIIHEIQSVLILGKTIDGRVPYPSKIAIESSQTQTVKLLVSSLKKKGIRVYFYFPVNTDPLWLQRHPEDIAIMVGKTSSSSIIPDPEKKLVNLTSTAYREYISQLCTEAIQNFSLDGVQLDYIRYRNGQVGFSEPEIRKALSMGINMQKIQSLTYQTFVKPGDWKTLLNYYDKQDPDVKKWAKVREEIITGFFSYVSQTIHKKVRTRLGLTLVSSGATAEAYTAIHFGQNWQALSGLADFATPMAYHGSNADPYAFVQAVCQGALQKIQSRCAIAIGLQAHATSSDHMLQAINAVKDQHLSYVLFRIGTFSFSHLEIQTTASLSLESRISWWNGCENQQITAYSLCHTGLSLQSEDSDNLIKGEMDEIKWRMNKNYSLGEGGSIIRMLSAQWNLSTGCCMPMVILHTSTSEMPTLLSSSFSVDHLLFSLQNNTSLYNDQPASPKLFRWQQNQTWVNLHELPKELGIQIQTDRQMISLWDHQNGLKITYQPDSVRIRRRIHQNWLEEESYPIQAENGILPARLFFPVFRFLLFFNSSSKLVHIIRWTPLIPSSIALSADTLFQPESLLLTDQSVWMEWQDYFNTSFYSLTKQIHAMGRTVTIFFPIDSETTEKPELRWFMMQQCLDQATIPDELVYWFSQEGLSVPIPASRTLVIPWSPGLNPVNTPNRTFYRWERKNGYPESGKKPMLWIHTEKDPIFSCSDLSRYRQNVNESWIVNWQCRKQFEK